MSLEYLKLVGELRLSRSAIQHGMDILREAASAPLNSALTARGRDLYLENMRRAHMIEVEGLERYSSPLFAPWDPDLESLQRAA